MVGRGSNISIGRDQIAGMIHCIFYENLQSSLHDWNITVLNQAAVVGGPQFSGWKLAHSLGLIGMVAGEWDDFLVQLREAEITLNTVLDSLVWKGNMKNDIVTTKLAYESLLKVHSSFQSMWWHSVLWMKKVARKIKCFFLLTLNHKILLWDSLQRRGFQGPSRCIFCLEESESVEHLFFLCRVFRYLWSLIYEFFNVH